MPFGVSLPELLILLVVLLLVFGAKRLPEMGKSLGKGMREFKDAVSGDEEHQPTAQTTNATANRVELPPAPPAPSTQSSSQQGEPETHQTVS